MVFEAITEFGIQKQEKLYHVEKINDSLLLRVVRNGRPSETYLEDGNVISQRYIKLLLELAQASPGQRLKTFPAEVVKVIVEPMDEALISELEVINLVNEL